jgi:cysteine desulfurase
MNVYLDNAATTPMLAEVVDAMLPYMRDHFGNPSSTHAFGRRTKTAIEQARRRIATHLGVAPRTLCFTSGGTEADNMALHASVEQLGCRRILTCATEHKAVLTTAQHLAGENGLAFGLLDLDSNGRIDLERLEATLSDGVPTLVSVMHGNNEVGILQDIEAIGHCCHRNRPPPRGRAGRGASRSSRARGN